MCQKVQCQLLAGRPGGTAGAQEEPVRVEDERVDNDNQDDGAGPYKVMGEVEGEVLEEDNGWGQEEEEEEEEQHPFQQDHVDVTNFLHLLNRSVTPHLPPES